MSEMGSVCASVHVFENASGGRGVWGQNPKPEHKGSVPGLLCQMTMVGGGGWWWGCSKGGTFTNASRGKRLEAKNPKPNRHGSVSGLPC